MSKVAIVTGGTRGIGAAISVGLNAAGHKVAASYAGNDEAAKKFKDETGIPTYKWDVADFKACADGVVGGDPHQSRFLLQHEPGGHRRHA